MNRSLRFLAYLVIIMPIFSCAGSRPASLGVTGSRLAPCPSTPNCASSDAGEASHRVPAFQLAVPAADAWRAVRSAVLSLPRTRIIPAADDYLHAECSSAFFGFVDDIELHLGPAQGTIAVRSAARLGHSDLGVNRKRVEKLHAVLAAQGVIR